MKGAGIWIALALRQFLGYPLHQPTLVCHRQVVDLSPRQSSVVDEEELWLEDDRLPIFRPKAKET